MMALADEQGFINHLFQVVAETHQIPKSLSDISSVTE
jgi:hypothetical protein